MKKLLLLIGASMFFASCETVVDVEMPDRDPKLVVNGFFQPDSAFKLQISESRPILDESTLPLKNNAVIELFKGDQSLGMLSSQGEGIYTSSSLPEPGVLYRVEVSAAGFLTVQAENMVPPSVPFLILDTTMLQSGWSATLKADIQISDPAARQDFYHLRCFYTFYEYIFDDSTWAILDSVEVSYPAYFETFNLDHEDVAMEGVIFSDALFNGRSKTISAQLTEVGPGVTLIFELRHISREMFLYLTSLARNRVNTNNPFSEPSQVFSNIDGGFGIFSGYSVHRDTVVIQ